MSKKTAKESAKETPTSMNQKTDKESVKEDPATKEVPTPKELLEQLEKDIKIKIGPHCLPIIEKFRLPDIILKEVYRSLLDIVNITNAIIQKKDKIAMITSLVETNQRLRSLHSRSKLLIPNDILDDVSLASRISQIQSNFSNNIITNGEENTKVVLELQKLILETYKKRKKEKQQRLEVLCQLTAAKLGETEPYDDLYEDITVKEFALNSSYVTKMVNKLLESTVTNTIALHQLAILKKKEKEELRERKKLKAESLLEKEDNIQDMVSKLVDLAVTKRIGKPEEEVPQPAMLTPRKRARDVNITEKEERNG